MYEFCLNCAGERHFNQTNNIVANIDSELILRHGNYRHLTRKIKLWSASENLFTFVAFVQRYRIIFLGMLRCYQLRLVVAIAVGRRKNAATPSHVGAVQKWKAIGAADICH